jgi:CelD/BcsL family acetyltransferase involved in cellulose biosynthesis
MQDEELRIVRSNADFLALRADWAALIARCPDHYFSQSFTWCEVAWRHIAAARNRELCCPVLTSKGRLVGIWPLVTYADAGTPAMRPLGSEGSEYCSPLVEADGEARRRTLLLWQAAARCADLLVLPYVRENALLTPLLRRAGLWRFTDFPAPAPYTARADYADWAAYQKLLSSSLRHKLRRVRRRLSEKGNFTIAIEPRESSAELIDWMLAHKKRWLDREGMQSGWIGRQDYRDFLVELAQRSNGSYGAMLFALKVDGVPIAAKFATVDAQRFEAIIGVYDPKWSSFSPGQILTEHCLGWSFERQLDFDFRIGTEPFKRDWAPRVCNTSTWYVATGRGGLQFVLKRQRELFWPKLKTRLAQFKNSWRKDVS